MAKFDAVRYSNNNSPAKRNALEFLNAYLPLMNWSQNETIMDVGTGNGTVLFDIILQKIPQNFKKVVASDISEDMLNIARSKSNQNTINEFVCLDIATKDLPPTLLKNCDHIFSLYCLHWVADQRQAFENLFDMLKPGGDMLLTIVVDHISIDVYEKLEKKNKWKRLISDFKHNIYPYRNCPNAVTTAQELLKVVGFVEVKCEVVERGFAYNNFLEFGEWALSVNPFMNRVPPDELNLFMEDFLTELKKATYFAKNMAADQKIYDPYTVLIICASRPP